MAVFWTFLLLTGKLKFSSHPYMQWSTGIIKDERYLSHSVMFYGQVNSTFVTSNYRKTGANGVWMWLYEWAIVNKFEFIHDDDWTFTSMNTEIGSQTFYSWGLKSILLSYNIHTCFPTIASNVSLVWCPAMDHSYTCLCNHLTIITWNLCNHWWQLLTFLCNESL